MIQTDEKAILDAIREAVETAVAEFGMEFVRTLSMFPSALVDEEVRSKAA